MDTYEQRITPRRLKAGQWLIIQGSPLATPQRMMFSHRDYRGMYWLRCPAYAGLNGPGDTGMVRMSGRYIARAGKMEGGPRDEAEL